MMGSYHPGEDQCRRDHQSQGQAIKCCLAIPTKLNRHDDTENGREDEAQCHDNYKHPKRGTPQLAPIFPCSLCVDTGELLQKLRLKTKSLSDAGNSKKQEQRGENAPKIQMNGAQSL